MSICAAGRCEWCGCEFRRPSDVMYHRCAAMQHIERDRLAEEWLIAQHGPEWYVGDATAAEWEAAYAAVDEGQS